MLSDAAAGFAHHGEGLDQQIVERFAVGEPLAELDGFGGEILIGEALHLRLEIVDHVLHRKDFLDLAVILGAENFCEECVQHKARGR